MQQIIRPLQISFMKQVVEQNNEFYFVITAILGIDLTNGTPLLEMDYLEKAYAAMGERIQPDCGFAKANAEFLVSGRYYSAQGQPQQSDYVSVSFAERKKKLQVFAPRTWQYSIPKTQGNITELDLDYHLAYGSSEYALNPIGIGYQQTQLPQIELAGENITDNQQQSLPAGLTPIDQMWPQRQQYQGSYDERYLTDSFPGFAKDMDWRWFNCAAADQQFTTFFSGNEVFEFENLHQQHSHLQGQLPNLRCRSFIQRQAEVSELTMNLDTVWFFPNQQLGLLYFRSMVKVADDEGREIEHILLAYEHRNTERDLRYYQHCLQRRLESDDTLLNLFNTQDLIADGHLSALRQLQLLALKEQDSQPFEANLQAKMQDTQKNVNQQLDQVEQITQSKEGIGNEEKKILEKINQPFDENALEKDIELQLLNQQLENIIPGITKNDIASIDLSQFSFKDIDAIMLAIEKFTNKKTQLAKDTIKENQTVLERLTAEKIEQLQQEEGADLAQQQQLQQQIEQTLNNAHPPEATLTRLSIEQLQQAQQLDPALEQALQSMQQQTGNAENIENLDKLTELLQPPTDEDAKQQQLIKDFFTSYRMVAHFQESANMPHNQSIDKVKETLLKKLNTMQAVHAQDWACLDLSAMTLENIDFSDCYLEQVNFSRCHLINCNFSGAILARALFNQTQCINCDFKQANFGAIDAHKAHFSDCDFTEARISKSDFSYSQLHRVNWTEVESLEIKLHGCQFTDCQLPQFKFIERNLKGVVFNKTNLNRASFLNCQLADCIFEQANMSNLTWANCLLTHCIFKKCQQNNNCWASFEVEINALKHCQFIDCILSHANFQSMWLVQCVFLSCTLDHCNFNDAQAKRCNFTASNLQESQFRHAQLQSSNFNEVNLMQGSLAKANLSYSNFQQANLYAVDFLRCTLGSTNFLNANLDNTLIKDWRPS